MKIFNKQGFTLVEMMIAIAIMGIMAAMATPTLQTYMASRRLSGAARQVFGDLTAARTQAVTLNKWVSLNIDSSHRYTVFRDNNQNGVVDSGETLATRDLHPDYHDVLFSTAVGTVVAFYPNGTGSSSTLTIYGPTDSKQIRVSSAGRVRID